MEAKLFFNLRPHRGWRGEFELLQSTESLLNHVCRNPWGAQERKSVGLVLAMASQPTPRPFLLENKAIGGLLRAGPRYSPTPAFLLPCLDR